MEKKEYTTNEFKEYVKSLELIDVLIAAEIIEEDDISGDKICCLFHDEKTPSMNLNEDYAYCFGCGWSGDVIKIVEELYDFSFIQTLSFLADALEVKLLIGSYNPFIHENEISLSELEKEWQNYLLNATNKIKTDSVFKEKIKEFFPLEVGYDDKLNYFVFRYTSKANKTLGFTKRRGFELGEDTDKSKYPKWKHSSNKNSRISECANIYGLGPAIKAINNDKEVILTEGPKDTIPFLMTNRKNVIAISGVHNKKKIFETIPKVNKVILSLDSDNAGENGAKDIVYFLSEHIPIENISWINYNGLDPYDYYQENKKVPEPSEVLALFNEEELKNLYHAASIFNKEYLILKYSNCKKINYSQAKSFFEMNLNNEEIKKKKENEKDRLVKSKGDNSSRKLSLKYDFE